MAGHLWLSSGLRNVQHVDALSQIKIPRTFFHRVRHKVLFAFLHRGANLLPHSSCEMAQRDTLTVRWPAVSNKSWNRKAGNSNHRQI